MLKVEIAQSSLGQAYFYLVVDSNRMVIRSTSAKIASILKLDLDIYNKILIKKVIKHKHYEIYDGQMFLSKDITFNLGSVSEKTYVERFKEAFAKELVLLVLANESEIENKLWLRLN